MNEPTDLIMVDTPVGEGRLRWRTPERVPQAVVLLGHGAGGQLDAFDLATLAHALPESGIAVVHFEQPWRTAGRKISAPAPQLDLAFGAAIEAVRRRLPEVPLITGGRSQGARVACRTAVEHDVAGVVCLAFPLHPPGRPEKSRLGELLLPNQPVLVCQGTRDSFGGAADVAAQTAEAENVTVVEIPGADHSMRVRKSDPMSMTEVGVLVVEAVAVFVDSLES